MKIFFIITDFSLISLIEYFLIFYLLQMETFDWHCSSKKKKRKEKWEEDKENNFLDCIDNYSR